MEAAAPSIALQALECGTISGGLATRNTDDAARLKTQDRDTLPKRQAPKRSRALLQPQQHSYATIPTKLGLNTNREIDPPTYLPYQQLRVVGVVIRGAKFNQGHLSTTSTYRQSELLHDGHVIGHLPPAVTHTSCWVVGPNRQRLRRKDKVDPRRWHAGPRRGVTLLHIHETASICVDPYLVLSQPKHTPQHAAVATNQCQARWLWVRKGRNHQGWRCGPRGHASALRRRIP